MTLLFVLLGGAIGAVARYLTTLATGPRAFPWATLIVNVAGSLILGFLAGMAETHPDLPGWVRALVGVGLCGALTTYSTFAVETVGLVHSGERRYASINVVATLLLGFGAASVGWLIGSI